MQKDKIRQLEQIRSNFLDGSKGEWAFTSAKREWMKFEKSRPPSDKQKGLAFLLLNRIHGLSQPEQQRIIDMIDACDDMNDMSDIIELLKGFNENADTH